MEKIYFNPHKSFHRLIPQNLHRHCYAKWMELRANNEREKQDKISWEWRDVTRLKAGEFESRAHWDWRRRKQRRRPFCPKVEALWSRGPFVVWRIVCEERWNINLLSRHRGLRAVPCVKDRKEKSSRKFLVIQEDKTRNGSEWVVEGRGKSSQSNLRHRIWQDRPRVITLQKKFRTTEWPEARQKETSCGKDN